MTHKKKEPLPTVLVTGPDLKPEAVELLESHEVSLIYTDANPTHASICALASEHQISGLIVRHGQIDEKVISASPQLQVIANHGAGYDNVDIDAVRNAGIPFFIARARNAVSVAEHALMLILALHKNLRLFDMETRAGNWCGAVSAPREFSAKVLGIIGYGATGRELARLAQPFGGKVIVYDPVNPPVDTDKNISVAATLDELLVASDVVSLHVPLLETTRQMINSETLKRFKSGSFLINTSRGAVIDESAVASSLKSGLLGGAGLDTFQDEPLLADHPFTQIPNILLSPHLGGVTSECLTRMSMATAENVLCILRNMPENDGDRIPTIHHENTF